MAPFFFFVVDARLAHDRRYRTTLSRQSFNRVCRCPTQYLGVVPNTLVVWIPCEECIQWNLENPP